MRDTPDALTKCRGDMHIHRIDSILPLAIIMMLFWACDDDEPQTQMMGGTPPNAGSSQAACAPTTNGGTATQAGMPACVPNGGPCFSTSGGESMTAARSLVVNRAWVVKETVGNQAVVRLRAVKSSGVRLRWDVSGGAQTVTGGQVISGGAAISGGQATGGMSGAGSQLQAQGSRGWEDAWCPPCVIIHALTAVETRDRIAQPDGHVCLCRI